MPIIAPNEEVSDSTSSEEGLFDDATKDGVAIADDFSDSSSIGSCDSQINHEGAAALPRDSEIFDEHQNAGGRASGNVKFN